MALDANGKMKHARYPPHPILSDYVDCLWTCERDFQAPGGVLEILPDSYIELVFGFGSPCWIEFGPSVQHVSRCFVVGLLDEPIRLRAEGVLKTVAARFFAWGFSPLLNLALQHRPSAIPQLGRFASLADEIERAVNRNDDQAATRHFVRRC
jgi:hypothetical protein